MAISAIGDKHFCVMKKQVKKTIQKSIDLFKAFQIKASVAKQIKGGTGEEDQNSDSSIIEEDIIN